MTLRLPARAGGLFQQNRTWHPDLRCDEPYKMWRTRSWGGQEAASGSAGPATPRVTLRRPSQRWVA
jgi:hypothetical protein